MNKENIIKWIKALRSGEYKQGVGALRRKGDQYCCLGVACDVYSKEQGLPWELDLSTGGVSFDGNVGILPSLVADWLGIDECDPKLGTNICSVWNDTEKVDFNKIADLIEGRYLNE